MTSRHAHFLSVLLAGTLLLGRSPQVFAQKEADFSTRCASWIAKKGYSRDYIFKRTGSLPPARAKWIDNIRPDELQIGDVVMTKLWPGHLGLIDEIVRDAAGAIDRMRVSSFNYSAGQGWIDRSCNVTVKFGIEVNTWVAITETTGYWRPKLPRK